MANEKLGIKNQDINSINLYKSGGHYGVISIKEFIF